MPREYFTISSYDRIDDENSQNNGQFKVKLPKLYQNVRSLKLKQACLLNDVLNVPISVGKGAMKIYFAMLPFAGDTYTTNPNYYRPMAGGLTYTAYEDCVITLPQGQYTPATIAATINGLLMAKDSSFFQKYQPAFRIRCKYESSIDRICFYGSQNFFVSFTSSSREKASPGAVQQQTMALLGYQNLFKDNFVSTDGSGVTYSSTDPFRGTSAMGDGSQLLKGIAGLRSPDMTVEQQIYMKIEEAPLVRASGNIDNYFFPFLINKDTKYYESVTVENTADLTKYFTSRTDLDTFTITFYLYSGDVAPLGVGSVVLTFEIVWGDEEPDGDIAYETFKRWAKDLIPTYPNVAQNN